MFEFEKISNSDEIREKFSQSFLLLWKEFKTENNGLVKLMTGNKYSLTSEMLHLYDMIAISKETTFASAVRRLKSKEGEVYFMSEKSSFPDCEGIVFGGVSHKGGVFKGNSKELAELIEREWEEGGERVLPLDLYVFDDSMKKAIVFTSDMAEYEEEVDGEITEKETRLCFSCKRRKNPNN